jgi:hypothetical protein
VDVSKLKGGDVMREVTTRQLKRHIEHEMIDVFEKRTSSDRRSDQKMVGLVEMKRRLCKVKKRTTC